MTVTNPDARMLERRSIESARMLFKRAFDLAGSALLLVLLFPVLFFVAALILIVDRHSPIYLDVRMGAGRRQFNCCKFRTMRNTPGLLDSYLAQHPEEAELYRTCRKLTNDPRLTALGRFLRRTSIDELPQLWNVFCGEMSLVGPRPITERELALRSVEDQDLLLSVRPGMTGLWQISGRCETSDAQRIALDRRYARECGAILDLWILVKTPLAVASGRGAK